MLIEERERERMREREREREREIERVEGETILHLEDFQCVG